MTRSGAPFRFASSDLAQRMGDILVEMRVHSGFGRLPPPDVLFLHRKLGGLYLLLSRLEAHIAVRPLLEPYTALPDEAAVLPAARAAG